MLSPKTSIENGVMTMECQLGFDDHVALLFAYGFVWFCLFMARDVSRDLWHKRQQRRRELR